jgi:protein-S-isoprenylcysteine O-methyltransferase Ste14
MTDASGGLFLYNANWDLLAHRRRTDKSNGGSRPVATAIREHKSKLVSLMRGIRNLIGAGMYLLLLGLVLEGLAVVIQPWISFPISLAPEAQILLTVLFVGACLLGVIWFNRSLNLIKVHLLDGKNELITSGPFVYVRHPLYATLLTTIPPLLVVWFSDLLFLVPWVLLVVVAHSLVRVEERGLAEAFGQDYERYRKYVPALLPYKGAGGKRYRREK